MLSGITITCFAASYAVALALEGARVVWRSAWLKGGAILLALAGLFAQSVYLYLKARSEHGSGGVIFASWYDWCLLAAWVMAGAYLGLSLRRPQLAVGLFMLPLVLLLVGVAYIFRDAQPFAAPQAVSLWRVVHGVSLLIGTVGVTIGFIAGLMYIVQSWRLKHKMPTSKGFRLPSLEWLQRMTEESLVISSALLAVGVLSGIVLNLIERSKPGSGVPWSSPAVWSSGILLLWLIGAMLVNWLYKPARQGRKVAWLTMASFGFLVLVLALVLFSQHATPVAPRASDVSHTTPTPAAWEIVP